uniref:DRBM domain-containing protein n=1 Tax=Cannabis sativa TaxID=3483 RepID=A0A803NI30_CANSA
MYKSKLQELCHKNQWGLPKYNSMRYGPDHNPLFGASVSVNGISFDSFVVSKSNKQAHNHVAMLAFLHFNSPPSEAEHAVATPMVEESNQNLDIRSNVSGLKSDSSTIIKTNKGERNIEEKLEILRMQSDDLGISVGDGEETEVKKQLQKYARQRNFGLPVYFYECDQGPEATKFKATVTVRGQIFESSGSFNTSKDAESDAAKVALMSFLMESFQEDESRVYKNLLQEIVQREDLSTPVYKTIRRGEPHKPIIFTSVELDGEIFHGKAAKSKKQAELDAARAAYVALKEHKVSNTNAFWFHINLRLIVEAKEKFDSAETIVSTMEVDNLYPAITFHMEKLNEAEKVSAVSSPSVTNSMSSDVKSYLLCNKVRVYSQLPNHPFPEDITVLPIREDKWVAVSLEFPNEK